MANEGLYKIVYDDEDEKYVGLVQKFVAVVRERTESWGFKDMDVKLGGGTWFEQLHESLQITNVTVVVILPNHDKRKSEANHASQEALMKAIKNEDKCVIPICLNGGSSLFFNLFPKLEFRDKSDWANEEKWKKLKKALQERCGPVSKKHADAPEASTPDDSTYFIKDTLFCDMSEKIGDGWWKLGIRLNLESTAISEIENNNRGQSREMIVAMLRKWKQSFHSDSDEARVTILCRALRAEKRNDLAKDIEDKYADFRQTSSTLKTNPTEVDKSISNDVFLLELAGQIPKAWQRYCSLLDVGYDRLQCVEKDYERDTHRQAFQALVIWRSKAGDLSNEAKLGMLIDVSKQTGRNDIVEWIKDKSKAEQGINTNESETGQQEASQQHEAESDSATEAEFVTESMDNLGI